MEGAENAETSEKESPLLQIDPKCFHAALRAFFQPIKTDDPRLDFYTVYKREATEYDVDYVKKYDEDLNTTLIFAGLFSAVSSSFVIDVYPKLQPDPDAQSAALLRAILLTLNHSAIPNESPTISPVQQDPPSEIVIATGLLYASLLISLLAAFIAMLGKQWLNRYLRHAGGSMIERCGDRQRKCDGLQKWPFHLFVESLPVMLQIALLLLACGLYQYMASVNTPVANLLLTITLLGVLFYAGVVIAGAYSYECPFQTPASVSLRSLWVNIGRRLIQATLSVAVVLHALGEIVQRHISRTTVHLPRIRIWYRFRSPPENAESRLPQTSLDVYHRSHRPPQPTIQRVSRSHSSWRTIPWFTKNELAAIQMKNTNDVRCVSWVLKNITDPEVLDAAIRLAGTVRWFDDGVNSEPPYDLIVSTFHGCFDPGRGVYPGLRDRAYYSGRAILWIHTLAVCKSEESARKVRFPIAYYTAPASDHDLSHLLLVHAEELPDHRFTRLLHTDQRHTLAHTQWISNVLLHLSWATRRTLHPDQINRLGSLVKDASPSLDVMLNRLLICCNSLGPPVEKEVLKIQDKSGRFEQTLNQVDETIISALNTTYPHRELVRDVLFSLTKSESRPWCLTRIAYGWCAVIWENRQNCDDWESLLLLSLEIGFRHDPQVLWLHVNPPHTELHQALIDTVFKSKNSEAIADLLRALISFIDLPAGEPAWTSLHICARYIVDLRHSVPVPFPDRLRRVIIHSVELIGTEGFKDVEAGGLAELFNHLHIGAGDTDRASRWIPMLLKTIQSPTGARRLAIRSWELLVDLITSHSQDLGGSVYSPYVTASLLEGKEWDKLECWVGVIWMVSPPGKDNVAEELKRETALLFGKRPGAIQKLARWLEMRSAREGGAVPESFEEICKWAQETAQLDAPSSLLPDEGSEESPHSSPPTRSLPRGCYKFLQLLPLI